MATLPDYTSYNDRDFDSLRARIFDLVQSVFPSWTDDASANFGNLMMESFCFVGDVLNFYEDKHAREGRFAFAKLRKSMIALCKLIGYELSAATVATCDVTLTIENPDELTGTTVVSDSFPVIVRTNDVTNPVRGEVNDGAQVSFDIGSGETTKTYSWKHQVTQSVYIVASTGLGNQEVYVPYGPFVDGSEAVNTVADGSFSLVDDFLSSGPTDKHYRRQIDHNGYVTIIFGDGQNGAIPQGNIQITVKTGGGLLGNVEAGSLIRVEGTFSDNYGNRATVTASNAAAAEGGASAETVNAARVNAPASIRVLNRTVSREDYEINAKRVSGVGRALMVTSNEDSGVDENTGILYVLPSSGGTPSQALLDAVETMCTVTYPNTVTFNLSVLPVSYQTVDVYATVWLRPNVVAATVRQAIEDALEDYFSPLMADGTENTDIDFGYYMVDADGEPANEIPWSDLLNVVRDVSGVRKVGAGATEFTLNGLRDDVSVSLRKFPSLGTVTLINGDTGGTL